MIEKDTLIESTAERLFNDLCTFDAIGASEQGTWQKEIWQALQETGLTSTDAPEELNGSGANTVDALNVIRLAGFYAAPVPVAEHYIGSRIYQSLQMETPLEPVTVVRPRHAALLKVSESERLTLNGSLNTVPWARVADTVLIPVSLKKGFSILFLNSSELTIENNNNVAGEPADQIIFNNFSVAQSQIKASVMTENEIEQLGALTRSTLSWGALERVLELTLDYAKERIQFGRSIAKFQAIQQDLAKLAGEVASTGVAVDHAIQCFSETKDNSSYIAAAKIRASESAGFATTIGHQIHGATGFTNEHILHHLTRRLWAWRDEYGSESIWASELGKALLVKPEQSLWQWATQ